MIIKKRKCFDGLPGVFTCSAGNFAQGLAWNAQQMKIPCTIIAPDSAPITKVPV